MTADLLTVLIIITLGAFSGTVLGLFIGYLGKTQKRDWSAMSRRAKLINAALVLGCSVLCIAGLALYAFR
jgi:ABC-type dipeptide/oligopeptide/nickel transport system permease subunit